jgi:hypothetical protein
MQERAEKTELAAGPEERNEKKFKSRLQKNHDKQNTKNANSGGRKT